VIGSDGAISSKSIFVLKYFAFTNSTGTTVIFDTASGRAESLVTCTAVLPSGTILTARGFFTSGGAGAVAKGSPRQLCSSYGGTFGSGPDLIGALADPVIWVCNGWIVPVTDFELLIERKLLPLVPGCLAQGGVVVFIQAASPAPIGGSDAFEVDVTCYGPPAATS
jgi:hypothetical protein